ncbi:hypothetical protein [uncultured Thiohalocapsa sp.]|uniref:hypothetical protein n=1 Tax=uncultured Thiohalocapsa sp. TaxID=768990 RepID=UPI0025ECF32D|nr:hypothetical protein [uncultured Thiohalocapsa sp.]
MTDRYAQIGFSQRVRLEWMAHAARLVDAGNTPAEVEQGLQEALSDKLSVGGTAERGNREKAITILLRVWVRPPAVIEPLRDEGLRLLQDLPKPHQMLVHWGMAMAVYPFWGAVAETTGRMLRLQGTAAAAQVQRRVKEAYGERDTVARAARRVLRSFHDWGVLEETGTKGVYEPHAPASVSDPMAIAWLMEAVLRARPDTRAPPRVIAESPALFPFQLQWSGGPAIGGNPRLDVARHGLDEEIVMLKTTTSRQA